MLRYALRRMFWAVPTLFGISLVVFVVTALIADPARDLPARAAALVASDPDGYDSLEEQRRQRFLDLPALVNGHPQDARTRAEAAMKHVADGDAQAALAAHQLARLGGAALPFVLPQLDKLPPAARARVALALAPIAERVGGAPSNTLDDPSRAVLFWSRFWEDRALDFTAPALHRAVHRLSLHATDLREHDVVQVDTFALSEVIPAMQQAMRAGDREGVRVFASIASRVTGRPGEVPFDASDAAVGRTVAGWMSWWQVHESDFVEYVGLERLAATLLQTRYGQWVLGAATGRLGTSAIDGEPIAQKLAAKAPVTLLLTLLALVASYAIAVPLGALVAWMRGRAVDTVVAITLFVTYSLPTFWTAQILARAYALAPVTEAPTTGGAGWTKLAAPAIALALGSVATLSRYQRAATLEVVRADFVRTAKAKGASAIRQVVVHALRNAMLPTVTLAGLQFPALLGGAFVVEEVFGVPGIGYETMRAVEAHDVSWLVAIALFTATVTTVALVASDLAYGVLDPRIRDTATAPHAGVTT